MGEFATHSCLILGVSKKTNGCDIDLDQANSPSLLDEFSINAMGLLERL
jgi:hypothetical protein